MSAVRRRSLVFLVSDFISEPGWERPLALLARRHEVVAVRLVDPMETEGLLLEHPAVQQVAVVGLPDERLGEVAVAYVQRRESAMIDAEEVLGHCRGKVASFKLPRHVVFIDAFPMTESGKIRKTELREDAKKRFGA